MLQKCLDIVEGCWEEWGAVTSELSIGNHESTWEFQWVTDCLWCVVVGDSLRGQRFVCFKGSAGSCKFAVALGASEPSCSFACKQARGGKKQTLPNLAWLSLRILVAWSQSHRVGVGLEGTLKIIQFQPPCHRQGTRPFIFPALS